MRRYLLVGVLAACSEPDARIQPAQVSWMEWPAEVPSATPFTVRLAGYGVSCVEVVRFVTEPTVDQSAVTFEPYFLLTGPAYPCRELLRAPGAVGIDTASARLIAPFFDTQAAVPGLEAQVPRTYEIRAGTSVFVGPLRQDRLPVRTFGEVTVTSRFGAVARVNAGGLAYTARDSLGCVILHPSAVYPGYVVENPPADTASYWFGFVRGYIHEPVAPVCGASRVFHLVTQN